MNDTQDSTRVGQSTNAGARSANTLSWLALISLFIPALPGFASSIVLAPLTLAVARRAGIALSWMRGGWIVRRAWIVIALDIVRLAIRLFLIATHRPLPRI